MATLSSHTLNSVDGTHAGGMGLVVTQIRASGERTVLADTATDAGGRFLAEIALSPDAADASYEMVLATGAYFAAQALPTPGMQILREVVVRFEMPDVNGRYHIPFMLAPNSYSVWWSG